MRPLAVVLLLAPLCSAADPPKALLTAKELADGWVQLFDGESTYGWDTKGDVTVKEGKLILGEMASCTFKVSLPKGTVRVGEKEALHTGGSFTIDKPTTIGTVTYQPADTKSLFNGKDLSGWKVFKGDQKREKSKFEVTKDGELRLTNGPGDLQTEGKYADFVLQLEFKTNSDGLNSGIFFRCIADQYQNGYEMQINNKAKDGDRNQPADGGTGAIYRRQAARKIVANDKEWTHLTLVAKGPTFATWVNGYPVCLWTDERPKNENPRQGLRLEAGHLSIQGHDPTTDLLFRNLKLTEIK
jgi:hypothetical protein